MFNPGCKVLRVMQGFSYQPHAFSRSRLLLQPARDLQLSWTALSLDTLRSSRAN